MPRSSMIVLALLALSCFLSADALSATNLRVNYEKSPLGLQDPNPHFSWQLADPHRGAVQHEYRLQVSEEGSDQALRVVHDSGAVASPDSTFVTTPGLILRSDTRYTWSVRVGDEVTESRFATGLLSDNDWDGAEWLESSNATQQASQMRRDFTLTEPVSKASLFVAVPGYGTIALNGARVDGGAGIRSWSQYDVRALYSSYDVSELVTQGNNTLAIYTGRGWYSHFGYGAPTVRAVLQITTASGKVQRVTTDAEWTEAPGPVVSDDEYNGVTYDARLETPGWDAPGFTAAGWHPAKVTTTTNKLQNTIMGSAVFPAVEVITVFNAGKITQPAPGVFVLDFEQNLSGYVRLKIKGAAGTRVQLRHAEALQHPPYGPYDGNIYVGNLRGAKATDVYILKGDPEGETFQPYFTQHGFRYVEVTGLEQPPAQDTVTAVHIRSAVRTTGSVSFSDPLLNQVQHNLYWGQSTNLMMVPTDCDQRDERLGWTGDSALTAEEALHNFDMGSFYMNWAQMLDDTSPNGAIGCTVPGGPGAGNLPAANSCDASWTSVYPTVLHGLLKYYGDVSTPQKHWSSLTRFIDNEYARITSGGVTNMFANFGDWVPPPPAQKVDVKYSSTFSFLNDVRNVAFMAGKLGHPDAAAKYSGIFSNVSTMFHKQWFNEATNSYADGGQTAQVAALQLGIVPEEAKSAVVANLVQDIMAVGNHTTCGIIGWRFECEVLSAAGHAELAYALMTQTTYPSYGFEIQHPYEPATTIWELWDGPTEGPGMNSRDHIMFGGPGAWLYTYLGGISQTDDSIGFEHAVLAPPAALIAQSVYGMATNATSSKPLKWAAASKDFPKGRYTLSWQIQDSTASTCAANVAEGSQVDLKCPGATISSVQFASYGTPTGDCGVGFQKSSCNADLVSYMTAQCVGKQQCSIACSGGSCGGAKIVDPCYGTPKHLSVQVVCAAAPTAQIGVTSVVPPNAVADTVLPTLGSSTVTITEGGTKVWAAGKYVPGAAGVTGAVLQGDVVAVSHGAGEYSFEVTIPKA